MCICIFFVCCCIYLCIFACKLDSLMGGGHLRRPLLIKLSILYEENPKIYTKTPKNMQIHINICEHVEKYIKNINICMKKT